MLNQQVPISVSFFIAINIFLMALACLKEIFMSRVAKAPVTLPAGTALL